ncbi:MAG: hypothetical protein JW817_02265 [Clostridiales bacterium]|nr:hypothetical protein [Clostridiales bacterium]
MNYEEVIDTVVKRLALHEQVIDGDSEYLDTGRHQNRRDVFEQHVKAERVVSTPEIRAMLDDVRGAETRIRRCKLTGLSKSEILKFEKSAARDLIIGVETRKWKRLGAIVHELDAMQTKPAVRPVAEQALELERLKLKHAFTDESEAMVALAHAEEHGYSESELLVLGSKGRRAFKRAQEVREALPPWVATTKGVGLLCEAQRLAESRPGTLEYHFKDSTVPNRIHVLDLVSELSPTVADLS